MRVATCIILAAGFAAATFAPVARGEETDDVWEIVEIPDFGVVLDADIEDGIVWLSTLSDGLMGYDGSSWVLHLAADGGIRTNSYNYTILVDHAGDKWIGRDGANTVDRLDDAGTYSDKADDSWSYYSYQVELENKRVFSMAEDPVGNKWFGMRDENHDYEGTVELLVENSDTTAADDEWYHYDNAWTPDSTMFADDDVRAVAVDEAGRLWIGYYASGVDVWDYRSPAVFADDSWRHFGSADGLASDLVRELHAGSDGRVWIGTLGGLSVYDPSSDSLTTIQDLPGLRVSAIDSDGRDHVWVGTDQGVAMLYRDGVVAYTYDHGDGIRDLAISELVVDRAGGVVWAVSSAEDTLRTTLNRLATAYGSTDAFFVYPNPLKSDQQFVSFTIVGAPDGSTIEIFDLSGQKVRELDRGQGPYVWDTLDSSAIEVPSGVYIVRMETPDGRVAMTKAAVVR